MFINQNSRQFRRGNPMALTVKIRSLSDLTGARRGGLHALAGLLSLGIAGFLYASARRWPSSMAES
jgi:hypothetical protein